MRSSDYCVYCGVELNRIENHDNCRSVEHMIPQVSVSIKRTKGEGDFHACKKCNSTKGAIDDVLGVMCRMLGDNKEGSIDAIHKFKEYYDKRDYRFVKAMRSVRHSSQGPCIDMPLTGKQIYQYGVWLAKGAYFINTGEILADRYLICVDLVRSVEVRAIKEFYKRQNGSEAFNDLAKNINIPNINGESFMIMQAGKMQMFICLNRVIMFHLTLLEKNRVNETLCNKAKRALYR